MYVVVFTLKKTKKKRKKRSLMTNVWHAIKKKNTLKKLLPEFWAYFQECFLHLLLILEQKFYWQSSKGH